MTRTGVAVVGAGHWGPHLIKNFADHPEAEVLWVIDTDPDRRAVVAGRYPQARTSGNLDVALGDDAVEAVVIATPTSTHYELVRAALEAGRHVLVEKPITDDVEAARRLCDLASEKDLVLMVGHVFLFNPAIDMARTLIERGELGRVYYLAMRRTNLGPVRVDVKAAWDLAAHDISVANYWLGTGPEAVSAGVAVGSTRGSKTPSSSTSGIRTTSWSTSRRRGSALGRCERSPSSGRRRC